MGAYPEPGEPLSLVVAETALGFLGVALSARGIRFATLPHRTRSAAEGELRSCGAVEADDPRAGEVAALMVAYAAGDVHALQTFPVDPPPASPLHRRAWLALRDIPPGETRSYGWLARYTGQPPGAARAVGAAVGANPIPLWLPCHRVVASDGTLHGFAGGLAMKQALLEHEGALPRRLGAF